MLKLKKPYVHPPTGWLYPPLDDQPDFIVRAGHKQQLVDECANVLRLNKREVPANLGDLIEEWICRRLHADFCQHPATGARHIGTPTIGMVQAQTNAALRLYRNDQAKPDQAARDERSAICATCVDNISESACAGCAGLRTWVSSHIPRKVQGQDRLYVCRRSAIMIQAQVNLSDTALDKLSGRDLYSDAPTPCWRRKHFETLEPAEATP